MPTQRRALRNVISIHMHCDAPCGGEIFSEMNYLITATPKPWVHKCKLCGKTYDLDRIYPTVEYEDVPIE
jgi:hypothetical protein